MEIIFKFIALCLAVFGIYILVRIMSKAVFKSFYETKDKYYKDKEGGVNGKKE